MFSYNDIEVDGFGISPSSIGKFFNYPKLWAEEHILGEEGFKGSTGSVLGSVVHGGLEQYLKGNLDSQEDKDTFNTKVEEYIDEMYKEIDDLDTDIILGNYKPMIMSTVDSLNNLNLIGGHSEVPMKLELEKGYWLKGTADYILSCKDLNGNIVSGTVYDWKTTSSLSAPKEINFGYLIQSLAYAKMANANGYNIDRICIGYITRHNVGRISEKTGKLMKDYVSTFTPLYHQITQDDWDMLDDTLQLMIDSIKLVKEHPEYLHIVFKSMELKQK